MVDEILKLKMVSVLVSEQPQIKNTSKSGYCITTERLCVVKWS